MIARSPRPQPPARAELTQTFFFDAAHTLRREIPAEQQASQRIHGHTYHAEVSIAGQVDPARGMVLDLGLLRAGIERVRARLDHHLLDEVAGLGIPTLENLCLFIWQALADEFPQLSAVTVRRQAIGDACTLRGPAPEDA